MFFDRHRVIAAALDGGVVGHDHAFAPFDAADAGDDAGAVDVAVIHAEGGKRRQFQERRAGIDQVHHAFSWKKLSAPDMALARLLRAAQGGLGAARLQLGSKRTHSFGIGAKFGAVRVDCRRKNSQPALPDDGISVPWRNPERNGGGTAAEQRLRNRCSFAAFPLSTPQRQARREVPTGGFNEESKTVIDRRSHAAAQRRRRIGADDEERRSARSRACRAAERAGREGSAGVEAWRSEGQHEKGPGDDRSGAESAGVRQKRNEEEPDHGYCLLYT